MPYHEPFDDLPQILNKILNGIRGDFWADWGCVENLEQQIDRFLPINLETAVSLLDAFDLIEICVQPSMVPSQKAEFAWRLYNRFFVALSKVLIEAARPDREATFRSQKEFLIAKFWHEVEQRSTVLRHGGWHEFEEITAQARLVLSPAVDHNGFGIHGEPNGSWQLRDLFWNHGYQGQNPANAEFIFLSLDANWDEDIRQQTAALTDDGRTLLWLAVEYIEDPETFWARRNVHHPLCLVNGNGDGGRFHRRLRQILDLSARPWNSLIEKISFVELLELPTYGKSTAGDHQRAFCDFVARSRNVHHIRNVLIRNVFFSPTPKKVFVCGSGTWEILCRIKKVASIRNDLLFLPEVQFPQMRLLNEGKPIEPLFVHGNCTVYPMLHLSATGTDKHLQQVANLLA